MPEKHTYTHVCVKKDLEKFWKQTQGKEIEQSVAELYGITEVPQRKQKESKRVNIVLLVFLNGQ